MTENYAPGNRLSNKNNERQVNYSAGLLYTLLGLLFGLGLKFIIICDKIISKQATKPKGKSRAILFELSRENTQTHIHTTQLGVLYPYLSSANVVFLFNFFCGGI